jgi:cytochrome c oxidase subunit IIa family protein
LPSVFLDVVTTSAYFNGTLEHIHVDSIIVIRVDQPIRSAGGTCVLVFKTGVSDMEDLHPKPRGTIAILVIFALMIVILWGSVYLAMLLRGATQ